MSFETDSIGMNTATLRARECRIAAGALLSGAVLAIIRAFLLPWLIQISPRGTFPATDPQQIQTIGISLAVLFGLLALWALVDPLWPTIVALVFYAVICVPDLTEETGFLGKGIISKLVMTCVLLRGLAAGLVHRMLANREHPSRWSR